MHELDNPIWSALTGPQAGFAGAIDATRWYPSAVAPFAAVAQAAAAAAPALDAALARGLAPPVYFLGVVPDALPAGWTFAARSRVLQLLPTAELAAEEDPECVELGVTHRETMLELARSAFPDYFRERTAELGTYLGLFAGDRLVAMAGERMATPRHREISGVCTHPQFAGRGLARRLTLTLLARHRRAGIRSFLHVSEHNPRAQRLYASLGFVERAALELARVERSVPEHRQGARDHA